MAKKNKNGNALEVKEVETVEVEETTQEVEETKAVKEKNSKKDDSKKGKKDAKDTKKNSKKKENKKGLGKKSKELYSELKKVSWPSFGKVVKSTGVVLLVVTICTLVLFGADRLFYWIFNLLMG